MSTCFLSSFVKFRSVVAKEKSKMSQPISGQGGHLGFSIKPKITNLKLVHTPLNVYFTAFKSSFLSLYAHINSDECQA